MPIFQVSSRITLPGDLPKRRSSLARQRWYNRLLRLVISALIITLLALLLSISGLSILFFLLLPVCLSLSWTRSQFSRLIHGTLLYDALTIGLLVLYYGGITGIQFFIHTPGFGILYRYHGPPVSLIIVVTTTLGWAVILAPFYSYLQSLIEQRFNRRSYEAAKAIEAFASTLREEIDLDKVRVGLFALVEQTMQPEAVTVWVRKAEQQAMESENRPEHAEWGEHDVDIAVASSDPIIAFALEHPGIMELDKLPLKSPALHILQANGMEIALPLASQGELIGLLALGPRRNGENYAREDRNLLNTLTAQVAPTLRVAQLAQEKQAQARERERIEQELRTAQDIQHTFLPKEVPALPGWQLVPFYRSAREVGGDFYDFFLLEDGRVGLVIGDVTDKGIPAALVMTATRTMLRTAAQEKTSPGGVLARVNDLLHADIPPGMFVTCFYAILDPASGHLRYANAGHEPPYRRHNGNAAELWATGMPLGMMSGTSYEEYESTVAPGDSLLFYSDGLVEAHNSAREMFGFPRLKTLLEQHSDTTPLIELLLNELERFTGEGWEQEDDVTMMTLQRTLPTYPHNPAAREAITS